ncbi:MAG: universal stress protein [Myxococcota bacterium]
MTEEKQKLLVPFSFTAKSEQALQFALNYSRNVHASIYLFHVYEEKSSDFRKVDKLNAEYLERMKQIVINNINAFQEKGLTHSVEDVFRRIANGKPPTEILKMAGGIGADVIIMGAPESSAFKKLVAKAPCTLVLVKEKDPAFVMV